MNTIEIVSDIFIQFFDHQVIIIANQNTHGGNHSVWDFVTLYNIVMQNAKKLYEKTFFKEFWLEWYDRKSSLDRSKGTEIKEEY